ncbi:MAG: hypothetical protein HUU46_03560 [Candidatus Hydrogenedentes bacterium]|nr:hypothetical protein [Candidatus Hydrogenedentota bacterium]
MRSFKWVLVFVSIFVSAVAQEPATRFPLKLILVSNLDSKRTPEYLDFLSQQFLSVESIGRHAFKLSDAKRADVVLLDWPQGEEEFPPEYSPLGKHGEISVPVVLLGSASLQHAVAADTLGGYGCTCLYPFAFHMRDHDVFKTPLPIDMSKMETIPLYEDWKGQEKDLGDLLKPDGTIAVLKLAQENTAGARPVRRGIPGPGVTIQRPDGQPSVNSYEAGWCTAPYQFEQAPDVEVMSGGINSKTPYHGALWRQGNLMHFGFHQTPPQLNDAGKALLINSIVYISGFTEDRPIAIASSIFKDDQAPQLRQRVASILRMPELDTKQCLEIFHESLSPALASMDKPALVAWYEANRPFLYAEIDGHLALDNNAQELGVPIDSMEFIPRNIDAIKVGADGEQRARQLLAHYVHNALDASATAAQWASWWETNRDFVFFSDCGGYQWYIDSLASKRNVPTATLRGSLRASRPAPGTTKQ